MSDPRSPNTPGTPVTFSNPGEPFVHPGVPRSAAAEAYAKGVQARQANKPQKYTAEVPGAGPAMPPLEAQHHPGMTMAEQAAMFGKTQAEQVAQAAGTAGSIVDPSGLPQHLQPATQQHHQTSFSPSDAQPAPINPSQPRLDLQQTDLLPDEAMKDPQAMQGQGAQFAVNQPHLAQKYGVVRNKQLIPPQALAQRPEGAIGNRPLSDTIADLQRVSSVTAPDELPRTDAEAEEQVKRTAAGSSEKAGELGASSEVTEAVRKMDDFDYDGFRQQLNRDILNNPDQRARIEAQLKPLSIDDMLMRDFVTQRVPIIKGKFEVEFKSLNVDEDLALKRILMEESNSIEVTERYLLDKFAIMAVCAGVHSINSNPLPTHLTSEGEFDRDLFWKKFDFIRKRPLHMIASLGAHHTWFQMRVRKLFVVDTVKNG